MAANRTQSTGFEAARRTFERAGMQLPPIPDRFVPGLQEIGEWCFSTCPISPMLMYFFDRYLYEALTGTLQDHVAISHAGHGMNSYALNYHVVDGPLILMIQASYGGAYDNPEADKRYMKAQFKRCAALIAAVDSAKAHGLVGPGRLAVFESGLRGSAAWGWLSKPLSDQDAASSWLREHQIEPDRNGRRPSDSEGPINAARAWLEAGEFTKLVPYPARKQRGLSDREKRQIRERIEHGDDNVYVLAAAFTCAPTQVAAIKARMKR
jgi:hypothetical protein